MFADVNCDTFEVNFNSHKGELSCLFERLVITVQYL